MHHTCRRRVIGRISDRPVTQGGEHGRLNSNAPKTRADTGDSLPNHTGVRIGESTSTSGGECATDGPRIDVTVPEGGGSTLDEGRAGSVLHDVTG